MENHEPLGRREEDKPNHRRLRKGMYILPSLFTAGNIAVGYYAISHAIQGTAADYRHFNLAAIAVGFAVLFDGLDGRIARMTGTTSEFGREFDSLADVVTFGVAPAVLAWMWGFRMLPISGDGMLRARIVQLGAIATFLFLVAGASRLARFNIQANPRPSNPGRPGRKYFVGMPIPAGAGVIAATVHFWDGEPLDAWWWAATFTGLVFALAFLMVSTWRFYSFKDLGLRNRQPFYTIVVIAGLIYAIRFFSEYVLFFIALTYMLSGVIARLVYALRRHGTPPPPAYKEALQ